MPLQGTDGSRAVFWAGKIGKGLQAGALSRMGTRNAEVCAAPAVMKAVPVLGGLTLACAQGRGSKPLPSPRIKYRRPESC